jgi:ABC-type bacteriocin/lantibiotic exporter with double-glycine peptidase domain
MGNNHSVEGLTPSQRFFRMLAMDGKDIAYVYIYAIFAGLITLTLPLGVQAILGLVAGGTQSASLVLLIALVTAAIAFSGILKIMQMSVIEVIQQRIFARSAFDFSYRIPRFRLDTLKNYYPPELINRFFDTITLQKGLPKILMDFSTAVLQIFFGLMLISFYHPLYVFFSVVLMAFIFLILRVTGARALATSIKESKYKYEVAHWLEEQGRSLTTFKLAGDTPYALRRTDALTGEYLKSRMAHFKILRGQYASIIVFEVIVMASLLALGSYLVLQNEINIGQFVAADIVVILVISSVEKMIVTMETIYDVLTALDKLGYVTDLPLEDNSGLSFERCDKGYGIHVQLEGVSFSFPDSERKVLNDLYLDIPSGETLCISGYNGSGKTTLLELLAGLFPNFKGSISYNGFPLRSLQLDSFRHHIGEFFAEDHIFSGTILENITIGDPDLPLEKVIQTTENLGLAKAIRKLPDGFNTLLSPEGRNISRNMRIKILMARAIVRESKLVVVEDTFSVLEPQDRHTIIQTLTRPDRPWTLILVSNDPIMASHCQRVIILKEGKVVESGTFAELAKSGRHFSNIFDPDQNNWLRLPPSDH